MLLKNRYIKNFNPKLQKNYLVYELCELFEWYINTISSGVISSYLFNYFTNALITNFLDLNIGAILWNSNVFYLASCDDLLLLHMDILLDTCLKYANTLEIESNPSKSVSFSLRKRDWAHFLANDRPIPTVENDFIYLGIPIGHLSFVWDYFSSKLAKVEMAFYMLLGLGCKAGLLSPRSIGLM